MFRRVRAYFTSLGLRLLFGLLLAIACVTTAFAVINVRSTRGELTSLMFNSATRTSELIRRAARYGMLLNRKEDVHQTLREIAKSPGVAGIRIYDKQGKIIFSARDAEIGSSVDLKAEACVVCHENGKLLRSVPTESRARQFTAASGEGILGVINPIENEPECSNASCHAHPADQTVLGVLDLQMSTAFISDAQKRSTRQLLWATVAMGLIIAAVAAVFVQRLVRRPVQRLQAGTQRIAAGDLDTYIAIEDRHGELAELARAFNQMTADLKRAREELTGWSLKLEQKVVDKTAELGRAQRQIVQMEKMASLGKLSATVAHELNNPLAGILNYARLVERELGDVTLGDEQRAELERYLGLVAKESSRCGTIVKNLLLFARQSGAEMAPTSVNEAVQRSLMLVRHHLEMAGVQLVAELLKGDDVAVCDGDQVQQALVALLVNAVEAMPDGGTLTVRLGGDAAAVSVDIIDTGVGIPADALPHIFEPFYSTKEKESGVGLGLAVVYGIVQRHGGTIDVTSEVGKGTTFHLHLPRQPVARPGGGPTASTGATAGAPPA